MQPVIGFDFGNYNSFMCFISDLDMETRLGGTMHDLLPAQLQEGIPSIYFYSKSRGALVGEKAKKSSACPLQNRLRCLKRHLGEKTELDGKEISYDDAITEVVQHCIRSADKRLRDGWLAGTNLVSLSYPASYTSAQRQRLVELVEKATLEDGTRLKVCGTIAEPAAAALDYLAEFAKSDQDTTVLVYDLGGGTFDLGLVAAYPKGRQTGGHTYYYDIINTRGIEDLGGSEFDKIMYRLLAGKATVQLNKNTEAVLRDLAEKTKTELSASTEETPQLYVGGDYDYVELPITRNEFEEASRVLLMKTIEETGRLLQDHAGQKPEVILLTGGASQMPMVQREIENAFPEYRGKIICFRPERAAAYGAARYGTAERNMDAAEAGIVRVVDGEAGVMQDIERQWQEIRKERQDIERQWQEIRKERQDIERQRQKLVKAFQDLERQKKSVSAGSAQPPKGYALKKGQRNFGFGKYKWRVLDIRDGKALLLAETILEKRKYHESRTSITWEKCDLRRYLNGEFLRNFSSVEQGMIAVAKNGNPKNQWYGTDGGSSTEDRVFLLSIDEAVEYFGDSGQLGSRPAGKHWIGDQYNSGRIAKDGSGEAAWWWLRSPGFNVDYAARVLSDGSLRMVGSIVDGEAGGVRPALWLNL